MQNLFSVLKYQLVTISFAGTHHIKQNNDFPFYYRFMGKKQTCKKFQSAYNCLRSTHSSIQQDCSALRTHNFISNILLLCKLLKTYLIFLLRLVVNVINKNFNSLRVFDIIFCDGKSFWKECCRWQQYRSTYHCVR